MTTRSPGRPPSRSLSAQLRRLRLRREEGILFTYLFVEFPIMTFNLQRLLALKDKRAIPPPAPPQASEAEREALFREIRSTLARRELNPLDVSAALSSLLEAGLSQAEIARRVGRSPAYVSTYLELATLPEELERLVREGRLRDPSTVVVLKRLFAESPDEAAAQIRRAMRENGTISRAAARKLLSDACGGKRPHRAASGFVTDADEAAHHFSRDAYWDALPDVTGGRDCRAISRLERRHIVVEWVDAEDRLRSGYLTPNWLSNDPNVVCVTSKGRLCEVNVSQLTIAGIFPSSEIDLGRLA